MLDTYEYGGTHEYMSVQNLVLHKVQTKFRIIKFVDRSIPITSSILWSFQMLQLQFPKVSSTLLLLASILRHNKEAV